MPTGTDFLPSENPTPARRIDWLAFVVGLVGIALFLIFAPHA